MLKQINASILCLQFSFQLREFDSHHVHTVRNSNNSDIDRIQKNSYRVYLRFGVAGTVANGTTLTTNRTYTRSFGMGPTGLLPIEVAQHKLLCWATPVDKAGGDDVAIRVGKERFL